MSEGNRLIQELYEESDEIDVKRVASHALCDLELSGPIDRALAWMILVDIHPAKKAEWPSALQEMVDNYWFFVESFKLKDWGQMNIPAYITDEVYGLVDEELMRMIHGDIIRTTTPLASLPPNPIPEDTSPLGSIAQYLRILERILFIFARLNPGIGYVQGFNELILPIYIVFFKAKSLFDDDMAILEAIAFQFFQKVVVDTRIYEFFDNKEESSLVLRHLEGFEDLQKKHLPKASSIITCLKIHPLYYCNRWFSLLFAREYEFPEYLPIWDALFARYDSFCSFLLYLGIAHLRTIEDLMDESNYCKTITALQHTKGADGIGEMVRYANELWIVNNS